MDRRHHSLFPRPLTGAALKGSLVSAALILAGCSGSDEAGDVVPADAAATTELATSEAPATSEPPASEPTAESEPEAGDAEAFFPDVLSATATQDDDGTWTFSVTLSSPYDSPDQYADAWRVVGPDGTEFGIRVLTHDHASEQPFTRSQSGIAIPEDITTVTIEGRDQANGWGGDTLQFELPS